MFKLPETVGNKYRFVTLAALRAEQLQIGALPRIDSDSRKPSVIAQEELAQGLVEPLEESEEPGQDAGGEEAAE